MSAIRPRYWITAIVLVALMALAVWWLQPSPPAGPWRAQVLDGETGKPLEGVIVLALWDKRTFGWPHPDRNYYDIDEVVSDTDGRIVIPARDVSSRHPFEKIIGPILTMFKPGYSRWRFRDTSENTGAEDALAAKRRSADAWQRFAHEGVVVVMPRAKTRDERRDVLDHMLPGWDVPPEKIARMRAAYERELISLGQPPRPQEDRK